MKKIVLSFLSMILAIGWLIPSEVGAQSPSIVIDGVTKSYTNAPVIEDGTTLIPMRGIFEDLGATIIDWDNVNKAVTATKDGNTIYLQIGSKVLKNEDSFELRVAGKLINNSTMVPLRFVSESLGGWCQLGSIN